MFRKEVRITDVNMTTYEVTLENGKTVKLSPTSFGHATSAAMREAGCLEDFAHAQRAKCEHCGSTYSTSPLSADVVYHAIGVISQFHDSHIDNRLVTCGDTITQSPTEELVMRYDITDHNITAYISAPHLHDWLDSNVDDPAAVVNTLSTANLMQHGGYGYLGVGTYKFLPQNYYIFYVSEVNVMMEKYGRRKPVALRKK